MSKEAKNKRWVIADIHGCIFTLRALWQEMGVEKYDEIFFLGDYIDRGTDSGAVIDQILEWKKAGFQIRTLMGNHEQLLLKENSATLRRHATYYKCETLLNEEYQIYPHYLDFLKNLELYIELQDVILVHAGLNFDIENPFSDTESMLWARPWLFKPNTTGKTLIHGHTPKKLNEIENDIFEKKEFICLDNGCVYKDHKAKKIPFSIQKDRIGLGNLLALELNSYQLLVVENQEPKN